MLDLLDDGGSHSTLEGWPSVFERILAFFDRAIASGFRALLFANQTRILSVHYDGARVGNFGEVPSLPGTHLVP